MDSSFKKRIKRRVIARNWEFFAGTAPGLEQICHGEFLKSLLSGIPASETKGGVSFSGRVHHVYRANLHLRTANRILMRIGEFKATNFRTLKRKLESYPWELFLFPKPLLRIKVTTKHSRLYHTDAVNQRFTDSIQNRLASVGHLVVENNMPDTENYPQSIYVRIIKDHVIVSLDSSGEALYKRGLKADVGFAPIRETIAAAALMMVGYSGNEPLIDPMCGSGTFSLEAAMIALGIPPGWYRRFAFMDWPCFRPPKFAHIRRSAEKQILSPDRPRILASDKNIKISENLQLRLEKSGLSRAVQVAAGKDFFDLVPSKFTKEPGVVSINPPYGLRMSNYQPARLLLKNILTKLAKDYKGWRLVLVLPEPDMVKKIPLGLKSRPLFHGGLNTILVYGIIL